MAHMKFIDKMARLNTRRRVLRYQHLPEKPVLHFSYTDRVAPFLDYFYNTERTVLLTNNFESNEPRTSKTAQYFHNEDELNEYIENLTDYSSNDEDRPVASDEPFVDSDNYDAYDQLIRKTGFIPPLTQQQLALLSNISIYEIQDGDSPDQIARKKDRRMHFIRGYCKELKRKRYAKAYRRFTNVREKRLGVGMESMALLEKELQDKHLNHPRSDEPPAFRNAIQTIRKLALKRKYLQYVVDPIYRQTYRERIYYNVNIDVPSEIQTDNSNKIFILDRNTVDEMNQTMTTSILRKIPNIHIDNRQDNSHQMDAFFLDENAIDDALQNQSLGVPVASSTLRDIEQSDGEENKYKVAETASNLTPATSNQDFALPPTTSITQSKVIVKRFPDPSTPNTIIRIKKSITTQSIAHGTDDQATSTTARVTIEKTDPDGNISRKQFSVTNGTVDREITEPSDTQPQQIIPQESTRNLDLVARERDSIVEALEAVGEPMSRSFVDEGIPKLSFLQSPRIIEWIVNRFPKSRLFNFNQYVVDGI